MPPIVSIIGKSKSGKTTLIEKLVAELKLRGHRVATIKHAQEINFEPGKDSWRHLRAGSEVTMVVSPDEAVLIKPVTVINTLDDMVRLLGEDYDIILTEGFKLADTPKIEVCFGENIVPLTNIKNLIAIVSDEFLGNGIRQFSSQDIVELTDFLERDYIEPRNDRLALYTNGKYLTLKDFPKKIITSLLINMVSSLKGVGIVSSLDIHMRKRSKRN
jgi:molybdopterin-guanine dinucleotide biosynthesis protein B